MRVTGSWAAVRPWDSSRRSIGALALVLVVAMGQSAGWGIGPAPAGETATTGSTFEPFGKPTWQYTEGSCDIDLSALADGTSVRHLVGCGTRVVLSTTFVKLSVPDTWTSWSCPPWSETCTPDVLWSDGRAAATIDFGERVSVGGFEYEPNRSAKQSVTVRFYSGRFGSGRLVGSITRQVGSTADARLFGAFALPGFRSAVVTNSRDRDFAIARIRV